MAQDLWLNIARLYSATSWIRNAIQVTGVHGWGMAQPMHATPWSGSQGVSAYDSYPPFLTTVAP